MTFRATRLPSGEKSLTETTSPGAFANGVRLPSSDEDVYLFRCVAREFAEGRAKRKVTVTPAKARAMLGRRRFFAESRLRAKEPGVATGLAWTPVGGEVLTIDGGHHLSKGLYEFTDELPGR